MMRSGMHKPPVPPKPNLAARSGLSPSTPRNEGLSLPSPGAPRRVKPQLAPKPCLSKIATSLESKPFTPRSQVPATQRTEVSNSQKGIQQENKKPNWDFIIPICLCSGKNCTCVRNTSASLDKHEKDSRNGKAWVRVAVANGGEKVITNDHVTNHKPLQETFTPDRNLNTDTSQVRVTPCVPHRTWSDEANGNVIIQSEPAGRTEEDALASERTPCAPEADSRRKPVPVPVPRKPRTAVLTRQEKVEEEREEIMRREGRDINVNEVKVLLERKGVSSPAESQTVSQSATTPCTAHAPPPRKRPFLFTPEKAATSAPRSFPKDVEEGDLGWDSSSHEMEVSVDKEGEMLEQEKGEARHQEAVYADFRSSPPASRLLETPELSQPPAVAASAEDVQVKVAPRKPHREKSPMAWRQRNEPSEERREEKVADERGQAPALKERVMKELPLPPAERLGRNRTPAGAIKPSRPSLGKQRAKSFSGADLVRSDGQSRNSFRKLLDLKLSVKMLPKLMAKGGPSPDGAANGNVNVTERKMSLPLIGVEQSVDGDEYGEDADLYYENIPYYEEIADYINVDVGAAVTSARSSFLTPAAWQSVMYNDEGIYEEQEPYMSFEKPAEQRQCRTPTDCERDSVDEEVVYPENGPSDDGVLANSWDEENDSSSISSKGDCEQPEESPKPSGQKNKSKIQHIATEIMTSESVFVDVLKLLHVDFRGAVDKASRQNGKPVIEERLLNQILYYLPQLYELNQNLLRELKQRVAKWDENAQLSDIFLKKGPYLKMYSMYIREFDKNVALLEEQSKRNSAFGAVVREFEASPLCANLALKHYLLKPVQRIPQYQLLLTDYLKNLSEDSADYKDTQAALAIVKEVANHANDIMKQGDNFQKLIQVQCCLIGNHEIVQPGRFFLKEGVLKKMSRKVLQPRMFFLFSDVLLYTTPLQSGQHKVNNMFSLAGMKVSKPSQDAYQNELNIESVERSFTLSASSASERDEWLEAISTAINDYTRKKITFISGKSPEEKDPQGYDDGAPLGSKAPIWIPDLRTTMCMSCTCEFTVAWRRHHCRACGKVVCKSCSSNKYRLEYRKNELLRVCDQCFLVLQQQKPLLANASPGKGATFAFTKKQKKIPAALKEVSANTDSSMSGYLQMSKSDKKQGKRLWFVIKDKVLYTYAASEDIAALKSQPLLGFELKVDSPQSLQFKLYHKKTLYFIFKADDVQTAQRWIDSFREAFNIS